MKLKTALLLITLFSVTPIHAEELEGVWTGVGITQGRGVQSNILEQEEGSRSLVGYVSIARMIGPGALSLVMPFVNEEKDGREISGIGDLTAEARVTNVNTSLLLSITIPMGSEGISGNETLTRLGAEWSGSSPQFLFGGVSWVRGWSDRTDGFLYNAGVGTQVHNSLLFRGSLSGISVIDGENNQSIILSALVRASPKSGIEVKTERSIGKNDAESIGVSYYWKL